MFDLMMSESERVTSRDVNDIAFAFICFADSPRYLLLMQAKDGSTPFRWASGSVVGNLELARLLVEHGTDALAATCTKTDTAAPTEHEDFITFVECIRFLLTPCKQ